jgi:hypothetical protein
MPNKKTHIQMMEKWKIEESAQSGGIAKKENTSERMFSAAIKMSGFIMKIRSESFEVPITDNDMKLLKDQYYCCCCRHHRH